MYSSVYTKTSLIKLINSKHTGAPPAVMSGPGPRTGRQGGRAGGWASFFTATQLPHKCGPQVCKMQPLPTKEASFGEAIGLRLWSESSLPSRYYVEIRMCIEGRISENTYAHIDRYFDEKITYFEHSLRILQLSDIMRNVSIIPSGKIEFVGVLWYCILPSKQKSPL